MALILLTGCGPAHYLDISPPLHLQETSLPWRPIQAPTAAPTAVPRALDDSLLTGEPCAPPCWQGLTPGVTAEQEVRAFLGNSPFVASFREEEQTFGAGFQWQWQPPSRAQAANLFQMQGDLLWRMQLWLDIPVTLSDVLARYDAPAKVDYLSPTVTGALSWRLDLYYPAHGLRATLMEVERDGESQMLCPTPDSAVQMVMYMPAGTLEETLAHAYPLEPGRQEAAARLLDWEGAGCIGPVEE